MVNSMAYSIPGITKDYLAEHIALLVPGESADEIVDQIARCLNVAPEDIKSKKKKDIYVFPRHISRFVMYHKLKMTQEVIAQYFSNPTHVSTLHSLRICEEAWENNSFVSAYNMPFKKLIVSCLD